MDRGTARGLGRTLRAFGLIVLPFGAFWLLIGLGLGASSLAALGTITATFAFWLMIEAAGAPRRPEAQLAMRVAVGGQVTGVLVVIAEPELGIAVAVASLVPVILALPYVPRRTLTALMFSSAAVGAFALAAPMVVPWGTRGETLFAAALPASGIVFSYILFQLFLWNASARMSTVTSDLRHVIEMSHDLAATLESGDVGNRLARHLALVAGADDCVLSTWDREGDRVATFGGYPVDLGSRLMPWYDLAEFPATRAVLTSHQPLIVDTADPTADEAETAHMRSVGLRTVLMLPLIVRGASIGIVELGSARNAAFSARDVELAELLVREAAVTFDNTRLYGELRELAYVDPLTGLANRSRLQDRIDHALERLRGRSSNHAAVLFIDLDHFKYVNDRFGHAKGDRVLKVIGERIRSIIRPGDTAGRLGGDEFAVLLEDVENAEAVQVVCQRLLDGLAQPVELGDAAPLIGASVGFALSGPHSTSEDLLRNADIAMYAAKSAGRGRVVAFRSDLLASASARSELASMLRGAEARSELRLHFQPVVKLDGATPIGVEALVRWQPEGHELHMPAEFIGLAEETGEILPIGRWVLAEGCRRVRAWQSRYDLPHLRLYVNLSARQFRDEGLVATIEATLAETGLAAANLTLEITEGTLLTPGFETVERIAELRALGLRLAIDDFGTGYSSLGYLHAFQVDELKIDRSFVPGSDGVGDAHVLSQAMVELGRALALEVVIEGIETQAQADWFKSLGCALGQGYLFAHPMPSTDLEAYLRANARPKGYSQSIRRRTQAPSMAARAVTSTIR